jgi:hypothetical protein
MTQAIFLAKRTPAPGKGFINGVVAVAVNLVSTANAAAIKAGAVAACNALYPKDASASRGAPVGPSQNSSNVFPDDYFDSTEILDPTGTLSANDDAYLFSTRAGVEFFDA